MTTTVEVKLEIASEPVLEWVETPELPPITNCFTSQSLLFQIDNGKCYYGHYHQNGYFYNNMKERSFFMAIGSKTPTPVCNQKKLHKVIRWSLIPF